MTRPTYQLRQDTNGTYAWYADGPELGVPFSNSKLPDMQLLGYDPGEVLEGAKKWIASRGIDADAVVTRVVSW